MQKEILIFDTETNGMPLWQEPSGDPGQPHIVQLAAIVVDVETAKIKQSIDLIIKPDGWEITEELTDFHGITNEYAMEVGLPERDVIGLFLDLLGDRTRIAYNANFDNRIIRIAIKRFFDEAIAERFKGQDYYCAMINARKIIGGKNSKLIEAYKHFTGKDLEDAHSAMADTLACMEVYFAIQKANA